jgi:anionic cell wall polymer biosynthesis LytR-Cps2A-Psr (LCP) family protein
LNKIVDTLGGIEVNVPCALQDTIDQQAFTIPAGQVQMDYLTTKRYIQSRYTTSDTSRNFRQQRVVWAMAKKALAMNAPDRVPLLYEQLRESVATDMTLLDMVSLVPGVYQLDLQHHPERLHAHVTEPPDVYPWIAPNGAWLFMPNYDAIQKELDQLFNAPEVAAPTASASECPATAATPPPTDLPTPTPTAGP